MWIRRIGRGFVYPYRGFRFLLAHTQLWPWAAAPFLITAWMIIGVLTATITWTDDVVGLLIPRPDVTDASDTVLLWAWNGLVIALMGVLFLGLAVVSWVLGNMIASPFYDVLTNQVEVLLLDRQDEDFNWRVVLGDAWMSIRHSALSLVLYLMVMAPLLLLNLIPGFGSAAYTVLSTAATVFFLARELMDIPLSRRRTPFVRKLRFISQHKALMTGLGLAAMVMLAVPGVNLLVMPIAVMGGTLLFVHLEMEGQGLDPR